MITSEGEGVTKIVLTVDGKEIDVLTVRQAAEVSLFSYSSLRQKCDEGKLIAIKFEGRWWIPKGAVEKLLADMLHLSGISS